MVSGMSLSGTPNDDAIIPHFHVFHIAQKPQFSAQRESKPRRKAGF
jgi:hypothetical protein